MFKLLCLLLRGTFHEHKWEILEKHKADIYNDEKDDMPDHSVITFILKCSTCGKLKSFRIKE